MAAEIGRVRRGLRVRGTVQAVGFRPAVYRVACALGLTGLVQNDGDGVWIEIEGAPAAVARFTGALRAQAPPLARIDTIEARALPAQDEGAFAIAPSAPTDAAQTRIPPDVAPCADCLRELRDPADRRHRYPFINCTACGPRYTIIETLPYDRARTTMRAFGLCARCRREVGDPADWRFHAEPNACPACGPRLRFVSDGQSPVDGEAALAAALRLIGAGGVLAVRGAGGFLLAADARSEPAVARLRARKARPHRPFALQGRDLAELDRIVLLDEEARRALASPARPIVLVPARAGAGLAPSLAPALRELGVMLPATPLQQLLADEGPPVLVMTSGNRAEEPLSADDDEAARRLAGIADGRLSHDRPIHTRLDDSVVRVVAGGVQPVRRARGFAPEPIAIPVAGPPLLAVGAQQKNTVCLVRAGEAFVSQHIGDLNHPRALALFEETIRKLAGLLAAVPVAVAHDLHPDYASTRWAQASGLPRLPVQHHHAHVASCLAENGRVGPAIGVAFDGTGCGPAGEIWGGEILLAHLGGFRRAGHLAALPLPGGEAAIRAPWRLALAALVEAGCDPEPLLARIPAARRAALTRLLPGAPRASSAGRWFDAVAALCGVRDEVSYDGQAPAELEALAFDVRGEIEPFPFSIAPCEPFVVELAPTIRALAWALAAGEPRPLVAARFHETLARAVLCACERLRAAHRLETVALSGGCFLNARLSERTIGLLGGAGFEVLHHRRVPPSDGGLSLGQAAVAAFRHRQGDRDVPRDPR